MTPASSVADFPARLNVLAATPFRLRFELNTGGSSVEMFTMAFDRARHLARALFGDVPVLAIVAANPAPWSAPWGVTRYGEVRESAFDALSDIGFPAGAALGEWRGHQSPYFDDENGTDWHNRVYAVSWSQVDLLLWNNLAHEIGIRPVAPVYSVFTDETCSVCLNAYDDRGMDVYAAERARIAPLYAQRTDWLLDYDRERMNGVFG